VIAHAFGRSDEWTVGIEEELFVLDPHSLAPAAVPDELLNGTTLKRELFAAVVELNTGVCASVGEACDELGALRDDAKRRAAAAGLSLAAVGTWPTAVADEQAITQDDGYLAFVEYAGSSARRQFCSGLHVHVAVSSPETCMRALESVLPWLPAVLAVSANSPYAAGEETGLASTRAEILALLPRSAAPPVFGSYGEWERFAEGLVALGLADEWTRIWWDVRPHPRFGTLEVRMPDQPTRLEVTVALATLVQALVARAPAAPPGERGLYAQNRWAALRFGAAAQLVHPDGERLVSVGELLGELRERLALDGLEPLDGLDGAGEQLELGRRDGLHSLCEHLVALTYDGL
jgi:glutamate---cysteine ligase / carboxylate-amine ligase